MSLARIRKAPCGSFKEYGDVGTMKAEASCKRSNGTESEIDAMASLPLIDDQHHPSVNVIDGNASRRPDGISSCRGLRINQRF